MCRPERSRPRTTPCAARTRPPTSVRGSSDDARLARIQEEGRRHALRVAVHLEPYPGRTPASVAVDLLHLRTKGVTDVYVYDVTQTPATAWAEAKSSCSSA